MIDLVEALEKRKQENDAYWLTIDEGYAVLSRSWSYDDQDSNEDSGISEARIILPEWKCFLDDIVRQGQGERTFASLNSFSYKARYSEGYSENLEERNYHGKVVVRITGTTLFFIPSLPGGLKNPIRLERGRDYL